MEGVNAIVPGDLISLLEQELVDCDTSNDGCDGGLMDYAFDWVINNGGIDTEANYPYTGVDDTCNVTKEETKVVSIGGCTDVAQSDSALLCATVKQPISAGIDGGSLDFQLYTGGICDGDCSSSPDDTDHAILIVGYGSEGDEDYWIVKNSWGTSWGMEGYIYIKRNTDLKYGVCAINYMAFYPTKESTALSPTSPPSPYQHHHLLRCHHLLIFLLQVNVETSPIVHLMRHVVVFMSSLISTSFVVVVNTRMQCVALEQAIAAPVITLFVILKMDCVSSITLEI